MGGLATSDDSNSNGPVKGRRLSHEGYFLHAVGVHPMAWHCYFIKLGSNAPCIKR